MSEPDEHHPHDQSTEPSQAIPLASATSSAASDPIPPTQDPIPPVAPFMAAEAQPGGKIIEAAQQKKSGFTFLMVGIGAFALILIVLLFISKPKANPDNPSTDLGPGVFAAAGLRGHLVAKWIGTAQDGKAHYQLRIEPIEPQMLSGFAFVTAKPPTPLSVKLRVLDQTGFALCSKEVVFHYEPRTMPSASPSQSPAHKSDAARLAAEKAQSNADLQARKAAEAERERRNDTFQDQPGTDGRIDAVSAEGELPCSVDAFKRAYYWDFSTNFPTLDEQGALLTPPAGHASLERASEDARRAMAARKSAKKPVSAFFVQGDDRIVGYDQFRGKLDAEGKSFYIDRKNDEPTAAMWASNTLLIHYKCDQHATCALTVAGGLSAVHARLNE